MSKKLIHDLILSNAFELYGQPKWTFGKNTCNTYEVFAGAVHMPGGGEVPAQLLLDLIEKDEDLTMLFSAWFMEAAMKSAAELSKNTHSHVTLSMNLLPQYAGQENFVELVLKLMEENGINPAKLQFELSEAQNLSALGVENLNCLHDEHGIGLYLANSAPAMPISICWRMCILTALNWINPLLPGFRIMTRWCAWWLP